MRAYLDKDYSLHCLRDFDSHTSQAFSGSGGERQLQDRILRARCEESLLSLQAFPTGGCNVQPFPLRGCVADTPSSLSCLQQVRVLRDSSAIAGVSLSQRAATLAVVGELARDQVAADLDFDRHVRCVDFQHIREHLVNTSLLSLAICLFQ